MVRATTAQPLYRLIPKGAARTFAMLRYQAAHESHDAVVEFARAAPDAVAARFSTAMIAARSAFRTANDDLLEHLLAGLVDRYPAEPEPYQLRTDLRRYQARYDDAMSDAEMARFLAPTKSTATALVVRSTYDARRDDADRVALDAVRRFPRTNSVLWAAAKHCGTPEHYERIIAAWREGNPPDALAHAVRPLAAAAARSGQIAEASQLYRQALAMIAEHQKPVPAVKDARLEGRGAWTAIEDLGDVLDGAGVPFFFAAGTALGLIREGRPLDLDGDIDVGVFEEDWDQDRLQKLFDADARFCPDLLHPYSHKLGLKHRGGSSIDIFRFYRERDRVWHDSVFTRWFNSPFSVERRSIRHVELPLPADADRYLTDNYGDWRTPDPTFDAFSSDAPNVESTWPEYSHFHQLRRAYRQLSHGDRDGTLRELKAAGEDELAATMEAPHGELNTVPTTGTGTPDPRLAAEEVLEIVRTMVRSGSRRDAVETLDDHLRSGLWRWPQLWKELVSLMEEPADYDRLRALWLAAPRRIHKSLSIQRAVARAASAGGEHGEARALLRMAIVAQARRRRRPRVRLGQARRRVLSTLPRKNWAPASARNKAFDLRATVALGALSSELDRIGVKPFLISGTLLGYLREGNFISWDKDIDVGFFTAEIKTNDVELAFDRSAEFTVRRLDFNAERLRVDHVNGIKVDIFPHYDAADGKVWHDGTATRWWNSPFELKQIEFLGELQYVPSDPERYLDENYGNWRVPEPNFDARIDAPNVEITDQDYFDTLLYFSMLDAVVKGNQIKRERYRNMLRELGEGKWLDEV